MARSENQKMPAVMRLRKVKRTAARLNRHSSVSFSLPCTLSQQTVYLLLLAFLALNPNVTRDVAVRPVREPGHEYGGGGADYGAVDAEVVDPVLRETVVPHTDPGQGNLARVSIISII